MDIFAGAARENERFNSNLGMRCSLTTEKRLATRKPEGDETYSYRMAYTENPVFVRQDGRSHRWWRGETSERRRAHINYLLMMSGFFSARRYAFCSYGRLT